MLLLTSAALAEPAVRFTQLAPKVWMHTSEQTIEPWGLVPSNGLLVVGETSSVLVDTAWNDTQTEAVLDWARDTLERPVSAAVYTHAHQDKMGGVASVRARGIPSWAHPLSNELAPTRDLEPADHALTVMASGEVASVAALAGVQVFFPGAGHTLENLVVHVPDAGVLFGGCLVRPGSSSSMGHTADGSVQAWAGSMRRLDQRFPNATLVVPSHGVPGDRSLLSHTLDLAEQAALPTPTPLDPLPDPQRYGDLVAVVVEQHRAVILEQRVRAGVTRGRRKGADPDLHDIRSAGKSITALAVGAAIADGHLASMEVPVWPLLGASDDEHADVTVRDLLTMSSGLDCDDGRRTPGNEERMYRRRSWRDFALDIPMAQNRGDFSYCTSGVFLLGQVVQEAVGEPFDAYVQRRIFDPLGIDRVVWRRSPTGEVQSGGQIELAPGDLAKLGRLVLDGGRWQGAALLPKAWIRQMLTPRPLGPNTAYGFLWWFRGFQTPDGPASAALMSGNGGNLVVLLPDYDAVIVVQSANYNQRDAHERSYRLIEEILASLPRTARRPPKPQSK